MMPFFFTPRPSSTPRPITFLLNRNHPHPPNHIDDNDHACGLQTLADIANAQYHELNDIELINDIFTKREMPSWDDGSESWDSNSITIASLNDLSINPLPPPLLPLHPPQPQAWQANPQQYAMQNHQHHNQHPQYYASSSTTTTTASTSNSSDNSPLTAYHPLYTSNTHQNVSGPSNAYPPLTSPYQELPPVASYPSPSNIPPNNPYSPTGGDPYTHTHTFTDHTSAYETLQQQEAELKRLRNTAASARFRAKKKKREASLERNAREKREQLERLEEKIRQLEKENTWLRELVLRKGERIGKEEERVAEEKKDGVGTEKE